MDRAWWKMHGAEAAREFKGRRVTPIQNVVHADFIDFKYGGNSGAGAISLAEHFGAEKITLLGYDCKYAENGKRHWHGDHPKGLGNCVSLPKFYGQFVETKKHLDQRDAKIINATRSTALDIWPLERLEKVLEL